MKIKWGLSFPVSVGGKVTTPPRMWSPIVQAEIKGKQSPGFLDETYNYYEFLFGVTGHCKY